MRGLINQPTTGGPGGTINQQNLRTQLTDEDTGAAAAWQLMMDVLGGGMSPMLSGRNSTATFRRLQQQWQNQGTGAGSFLNWLTPMTQR